MNSETEWMTSTERAHERNEWRERNERDKGTNASTERMARAERTRALNERENGMNRKNRANGAECSNIEHWIDSRTDRIARTEWTNMEWMSDEDFREWIEVMPHHSNRSAPCPLCISLITVQSLQFVSPFSSLASFVGSQIQLFHFQIGSVRSCSVITQQPPSWFKSTNPSGDWFEPRKWVLELLWASPPRQKGQKKYSLSWQQFPQKATTFSKESKYPERCGSSSP